MFACAAQSFPVNSVPALTGAFVVRIFRKLCGKTAKKENESLFCHDFFSGIDLLSNRVLAFMSVEF